MDSSIKVVHALVKKINATHIIDVGSGLGYLSGILAHSLEIPVLGLEISESNIVAADKRKVKIKKFLEKDNCRPDSLDYFVSILYQVCLEDSSETFRNDILQFIKQYFPNSDKEYRIVLIGLHTCGDLACKMIKYYCEIPEICGLYNLGCCYNKLSLNTKTESCFPLSNFTKNIETSLNFNRRFMLLGCQSIDRDIEFSEKTLKSLEMLNYRARLEV